jgi:hypothetical protein
MIRTIRTSSTLGALCIALAFSFTALVQAQSITFIGSTTSSDYSPTGLNIGNDGFWFPNFAATTPVDGAAIDSNDRNSLPSWVSLDPTPDTTFASSATTSGGHTPWAFLTLPDGENGLSGAVVDSGTNNNSNNTIRQLELGPGTPSKFLLHVVTDNTAGDHDPAGRLRARAEDPGNFDISGPSTPPGLAANMDGTPDVYTWLYEGMTDTSYIKLQLNSGDALKSASIGGIMFDVVPEPSSFILLLLGTVACGLRSGRQRRG